MSDRDDFKPKLGKPRARGSKRGESYARQVLRSVAHAGGFTPRGSRSYSGVRIGRGAGVGRVLADRSRFDALRRRFVVVKSRIVRIKGKGLKGAQSHLRYIQRDGVTREGTPGELYGKDTDRANGKAFLERGEHDRHQFRFIVSAEDADRYDDLKPFVRQLMATMEKDLDTKLDWVAVDHHNTGHSHTHIVLRGRDDRDRDLVIARDYISEGMRQRASDIVTFDLGPRTELEIEERLSRQVEQERFTGIDKRLLLTRDARGHIRPIEGARSPFDRTLRVGRLQKLKRLGLADEIVPGVWTVADNLEPRLRQMGLRDDIIKTMNRELVEKSLERPASDYVIYDPAQSGARTIRGRVISKGLSDELTDRQYLIIDGTDGYTHYVDVGAAGDDPIAEGHIIAVSPKNAEVKDVDRTVADIAAAHGGRYDLDIHLRHDPSATAAFAETHIRRLEAIRRLTGGVERTPEGTWLIGQDHLQKAEAYERQQMRRAPVNVQALSRVSLDRQITADGATWLDSELTSSQPVPLRDHGFGRETAEAQARRRAWLMEQDLAALDGARVTYRANLLAVLRRRELARVSAELSEDTGKTFEEPGRNITGTYRKSVGLVSGRYALIETGDKAFTLVPWRPVLERNLGREVSGIARGDTISWTIGRVRGLSR